MVKVKITQSQADAIVKQVNKGSEENLLIDHARRSGWINEFSCLNSLTQMDMARVILGDYEVEPEFKVGDWVFYEDVEREGKSKVRKVRSTSTQWATDFVGFTGGYSMRVDNIRHATPEEIAKEKERRWWAKHDRDVWEIRQGDVLMATRRHIFEVTADPKSHEFGVYTRNDEFDFYIEECKDENWKVICFRDDRKDV